MKLPLTIIGNYKTDLTYKEILSELGNQKIEEIVFGSIKLKEYAFEYSGKEILIQKYSDHLLDFMRDYPPFIRMIIVDDSPLTFSIKFIPSYKMILLIGLVFIFSVFSLFEREITINGVLTEFKWEYKLGVLAFMALVGLWCWFKCIKPIKETEKWLMNKLDLEKINS